MTKNREPSHCTRDHTTYQMQIDRYGFLLHLYYGGKADGCMDYLLTYYDRGFSGNPYEAGTDKTYSMDSLPQEFPSLGTGGLPDAGVHHQEYGPHVLQRFPLCEPRASGTGSTRFPACPQCTRTRRRRRRWRWSWKIR